MAYPPDRRIHAQSPTQANHPVGRRLDDWLDQALADTFPASDPLATPPMRPAAPDRVPTPRSVNETHRAGRNTD